MTREMPIAREVSAEDRPVQRLHLRSGIRAELVDQASPGGRELVEGFGGAAGGTERPHEHGGHRLDQRIPPREIPERAEHGGRGPDLQLGPRPRPPPPPPPPPASAPPRRRGGGPPPPPASRARAAPRHSATASRSSASGS